ncbi:MAG: sigma-54 interaction domain-containing protein [Bacillota bacterium]
MSEVTSIAQEVCNAIASVLGVDVEIVDDRLLRVAGTGKYRTRVGWSLESEGAVYRYVLNTGKGVAVTEPGKEAICKDCDRFGVCEETAELSSPIIVEGKTIGVIGLVCFDEDQRNRMVSRLESHKEFTGHMADLLAAKAVETELFLEKQLAAEIIMLLMDKTDEAVIAVDQSAKVIYLNSRAEKMIGIKKADVLSGKVPGNGRMKAVFELFKDLLSSEKKYSSQEIFLDLGDGEQGYMVSTSVLEGDGHSLGAIASIIPLLELHRWAYDITHGGAGPALEMSILVGNSSGITEVKNTALRVARSPSTVLIRGESGTGKELLARAIHSASNRADKPFVAVNCAAIPDGLLESELFGYEEGSFTGARKGGKPGKFEIADGGTLFLDEIGDMSLHLQAKLLRVLQERQVERIGSTKGRQCDVRIIAATNQDLEFKMQHGEFRDDLYFRLNVIPIRIPPLRERLEDIEPLVWHFVWKYSEIMGKQITGIDPKVFDVLKQYSWPGNVRELENAVEYAINFENDRVLQCDSLPQKLRIECGSLGAGKAAAAELGTPLTLEQMEVAMIRKALEECGSTYEGKKRAASVLGIGIATLYRKIARYGLEGQ